MNFIITEDQVLKLSEDINIPVNTGDTVLMGKFKNKKTVVKNISKDEYDMPTINGKKAATFRIPKAEVIGFDSDGFAHNKEELNEVDESDVDLSSFEQKGQLNQKIWNDNKMLKPIIRKRLLDIADDFIQFINLDDKNCEDLIFIGSLAGFNWSRYSDIDLHIVVDFKKINKNLDLVREFFDAKKTVWNDVHSELKIYGFPVEIYVQDVDEHKESNGVYSVEKNKWVKFPKQETVELDEKQIKRKVSEIMSEIDILSDRFNNKLSNEKIKEISKKIESIYKKIKRIRKSGLESDKGELSFGNIVFKALRRSGYISIIHDLRRKTYNKLNSLV